MKRLLALAVCALFALSSLAVAGPNRGIVWQKDFRQAARQSARQRKPMLVLVTAPWCGYCQKMQRETFTDRNIADAVNTGYLPVMVDNDTNERLVGALGVEGLPTTLVISPDLKVISSTSGYQSAKELQATLIRSAAVQVRPTSKASFVNQYAPPRGATPTGPGTSYIKK